MDITRGLIVALVQTERQSIDATRVAWSAPVVFHFDVDERDSLNLIVD